MAAEIAKKKTLAKAPLFASDARANRKLNSISSSPVKSPSRKIVVSKEEPFTPSLWTHVRANQRFEVYNKKGNTHRLDNPFSPAEKFKAPEPIRYKGKADHPAQFSLNTQMRRSLDLKYAVSIVTEKGGNAVTEDMFKPKINQPKKKKRDSDDEESDNSDTPA